MDERKTITDAGLMEQVMEQLIAHGPDGMASAFTALFNMAMRIERDRHLHAGPYERSPERQGHANGYRPKRLDSPAGTVEVSVPKSRGGARPFYPASLERGRRSTRAVMLAVAEMYIQGVSTRDVEKVMAEFGLESLSSSQVSRAARMLDEELAAWRARPLETCSHLYLDARYEKVRINGVVRDGAVLSAVGIDGAGKRSLRGVSVALSEAEIHWRKFLDGLVARGLRGVKSITSDDHAGLRAARRAVFTNAKWQRCQFHLAQNAIHHAPSLVIRKRIGAELRAVWNAPDIGTAQENLDRLVAGYRKTAPQLADWLESNIPEGLTVFDISNSDTARRRLRTSNPIERAVQQEFKRRTAKIRVFPNEDALLRLVTALAVEIDEQWQTSRAYLKHQPETTPE